MLLYSLHAAQQVVVTKRFIMGKGKLRQWENLEKRIQTGEGDRQNQRDRQREEKGRDREVKDGGPFISGPWW